MIIEMVLIGVGLTVFAGIITMAVVNAVNNQDSDFKSYTDQIIKDVRDTIYAEKPTKIHLTSGGLEDQISGKSLCGLDLSKKPTYSEGSNKHTIYNEYRNIEIMLRSLNTGANEQNLSSYLRTLTEDLSSLKGDYENPNFEKENNPDAANKISDLIYRIEEIKSKVE